MTNINWDAVAAIAEILGLFGLVASLVFVGVQMRQTAKAIQISSTHAVLEGFRDGVFRLAESEGIATSFQKEVPSPGSGTSLEQFRFALFVQGTLHSYANAYYQYCVGALDETAWTSIDQQVGNFMQTPGMRDYWRRSGGNYPAQFVKYINEHVLDRAQDEQFDWAGTRGS